jgi:hypothetical protein
MEARYLALLILVPFVAVFAYATWHEYRRFKQEGRSTYGLTYDPETNTTHVDAIHEDEDSYDPEDFNPENGFGYEAEEDPDRTGRDSNDPNANDEPQDSRT